MQTKDQFELTKAFAKIFSGLQRGYGLWSVSDGYDFKHHAPTLETYLAHLEGKISLGIVPITDKGNCRFGVIDFDDHKKDKTKPVIPWTKAQYKKLTDKIKLLKLPLTVFKSKTGGAHCYLFLDKYYKAADVIHILKKFAYALGCERDVEIFPKQESLFDKKGNRGDGNFINLPYKGGNTRVLIDFEGNELNTSEAMLYASKRVTNESNWSKFKLLDHGKPQHRNDRTFAAAVFLKHHFKDWENKVHTYNELFNDPPLGKHPKDTPNRLEATILKSVRKKDYSSKPNEKPPSSNSSAWREGTTAKEIKETEYPPIEWVVEGLIGPGVTFISGKSKIGKSLLAEQVSDGVENGGEVLGCKCAQGSVLHYALEDGKRRKKSRWGKMGINPINTLYQFRERKPKIPLLTMGLEEEIEDWIKNTPDAKLVIIDPYVKVKKTIGGYKLNAYENDNYNLQDIYTLANKYNIAIVFIHHTKKKGEDDVFDEMNGSAGIQSNADSMIVISSNRKMGTNPILSCLPKDAEQKEFEISLNPKLMWEYVGKPGQANKTQLQKMIIDSIKRLETGDGVQVASIKADISKEDDSYTKAHVQTELGRLVNKTDVIRVRKGIYKSANY